MPPRAAGSDFVSDLHARSDELQPVANALGWQGVAMLSQASLGWRDAALRWLAVESTVQLGLWAAAPRM